MEMEINSKDLDLCLTNVKKVVPNKASMDVLKNFLFKVTKDSLTVYGSDLEFCLSIQIPCESDGELTFMVPAEYMFPLVKGLPDQVLRFVFDNQRITVYHNNGHFFIPISRDVATDPSAHTFADKSVVNVMAVERFAGSYALVAPFVDKPDDSIDAMFSSVNFEFTERGLCVVGSNGRGLALREIPLENVSATQFLISASAVSLLKVFNTCFAGSDIRITSDDSFVSFVSDRISFDVRKSAVKYKNYRSVIPASRNASASVDRRFLLGCLQRVESICSNHLVSIEFGNDAMKLTASDLDAGVQSEDSLPCIYEGEPLSFAMNTGLLFNGSKVLGAEKINFDLMSPTMPAKVYPSEEDGRSSDLILLMPMVMC